MEVAWAHLILEYLALLTEFLHGERLPLEFLLSFLQLLRALLQCCSQLMGTDIKLLLCSKFISFKDATLRFNEKKGRNLVDTNSSI